MGRSLGFGVLDLMGGGWNTIISGLMLYFFTTYGGVTATQSGSIMFIARIVDAVVSLFIGPLTDNLFRYRVGKKYGRRHFFLMIGVPLLLLLIFPLLFIAGRGYWWYLFVYLVVEIVIAMILIPWETLPTEMTDDYTQRTKLSSTRMFLSATATFLVFFIPAQIKSTNNPNAYFITGLIFAILFAVAVSISYFTTWERKLTPEFLAELEARPKVSVTREVMQSVKSFGQAFRNSSFNKHLAVYQAGRAVLEFTPWNVYPFIPDVDKLISRQDRAGIYAAVMTFGRKSTGAVATLLLGWIMDLGGFLEPGTANRPKLDPSCTDACPLVQTSTATHTIAAATVFGPLILIGIALIISRFIYLNAETHEVLRAEIDRLEAGGSKEDVTPEARKVCEKLTGHRYEELWPEELPEGAIALNE